MSRRKRMLENLDRDIQEHIERETQENISRGMSPEEAHYVALRKFGNVTRVQEETREVWSKVWLEQFLQDVRYGLRMLGKSPIFTTVAILTLALGIGANTAIFSVVNSILLRPLAYRQAQQLYLVREIVPELSQTYPTLPANLPNFRMWQRECRAFDDVAIVKPSGMTLTGSGNAEQISGGRASANLFDVLGVVPQLGRMFLPEEDLPGKDHVVILTDSFWRGRFHGDPAIVGQSITLDDAPFQVVGILPASFRFPKGGQLGDLTEFPLRTDFFTPLGLDPQHLSPLGEFDYAAIARLKVGINAEKALAELNVIQAQIANDAKQGLHLQAQLIPLETQIVGSARRGLVLLLGGVGAVLLIGCVNLANLLLARVPGRLRETCIRIALGASRARLARQLLTESTLLALLGGTLGIVLAYFGLHGLIAAAPVNLPRLDEVHVDTRVLWFTVAVTLLTGVLFGALPAWRVAHAKPQEGLKASATTTTESRPARRLRDLLIGFEVGISTLLLIVAGLLTMSMVRLLGIDKGFTAEHVLTVDFNLPTQSYTKLELIEEFYENLLARVRALPGVSSAGWISKLPLQGQDNVNSITVPGRSTAEQQILRLANYRFVSPGYFQSMGIALLRGRSIEPTDTKHQVGVISEIVAKKLWPGEDPLGKQFHPGDDTKLVEVIGVVADIRTVALDEPPLWMVYLPGWTQLQNWNGSYVSLVVRSTSSPESLGSAVRSAIQSVDPGIPIGHLRTMTEIVSESVGVRRFQMGLVSLFAVFALLLSVIGTYGVVGYSVAQRRQELGIRIALGAQGSDLRNLILLHGMSPVVVGWAVGVLLALAASSVMRSLLFGVTARDPLTIASITLVIFITTALACYIPARRAMRVDPMAALRYE